MADNGYDGGICDGSVPVIFQVTIPIDSKIKEMIEIMRTGGITANPDNKGEATS